MLVLGQDQIVAHLDIVEDLGHQVRHRLVGEGGADDAPAHHFDQVLGGQVLVRRDYGEGRLPLGHALFVQTAQLLEETGGGAHMDGGGQHVLGGPHLEGRRCNDQHLPDVGAEGLGEVHQLRPLLGHREVGGGDVRNPLDHHGQQPRPVGRDYDQA